MSFTSILRSTALATLALSATLSSAMPINLRTQRLVARGDDVGKSCYPLTLDQAKQLPGWSKIEQYAKDTWGEGGVNLETNPSAYPDRGASACIGSSRIAVQYSEKPQCSTTKDEIHGTADGTTQEVKFKLDAGVSQTSTWTVTQSSSLTTGAKFGVSVGIPDLGLDASAETYFETTITDERSSSFSTTGSSMRGYELTYTNEPGKECKLTLETKSCTAGASGRAPIVATGVVWFNYEDKRAPIGHPEDGEHYKYAAFIDSILTPEERTLYTEFRGPINSQSKASYATNCVEKK
ncbi:hypothetical protein D9611_014107 [Ephemerocybe angulata]|uniref:Uncharacterized protein n=1 Tax=Ephemerocybe angulata TaxID=980116 RepID=A0A8H5B9E0_9AGAR|nr:hypothetical protein D9611_014107 [Tulosesus angulatus]